MRTLSTIAAGATLTVAAASLAVAHSGVGTTSPRNGAVVRTLPGVVTVTFAGPVGRVERVRVVRAGTTTNYVTRVARDPRNVNRVRAVLKAVGPKGTYTVTWAVRAADGHRQTGKFTFRTLRRG